MDKASFKEVSPCRDVNDRKAKLLKLEQEQLRQDDALLLEEDRLQDAVRAAQYQQALRRYHSRKVNARSLEEGDLVLRRVQSAKNSNKLTPKWEGPYRVK